MRILTQQECKEWLRVCLGKDSEIDNLREDYVFSVGYALPVDTGTKTAVARGNLGTQYHFIRDKFLGPYLHRVMARMARKSGATALFSRLRWCFRFPGATQIVLCAQIVLCRDYRPDVGPRWS